MKGWLVRISSVLAPRPATLAPTSLRTEVILSLFTKLTNDALSAYSEPDPIPGVMGNQMKRQISPMPSASLTSW